METPKPNQSKGPAAKPAPGAKTAAPGTPAPAKPATPVANLKVPPLFRKIDWLTMLIAFGVVWFVYFLTLAPEVTLEDSGELCTGAFYAGIPHPPGYPFWSLYSWLWTAILPFGNVAWRVEMGESFGAAMGCGLVGLMVSRGSSMLLEGIADFKGLTGKWENLICIVCGSVVGIMLGVGGVMWSESVAINRISLFGVPWVMLVMACMMRWIYAPHQRRFLFFAMFVFGICSTIHQTLLCAAMGLEVAVAMAQPRLGRTFFLGNSIIFLGGVIAHLTHLSSALEGADELLNIFLTVGVLSIAGYVWLAIVTREGFLEFCQDATLTAALLLALVGLKMGSFYLMLAVLAAGGFVYFAVVTWKLGHEWLPALCCGALVFLGCCFYLYEPIAGMTDPPMQWGYPRTVEGFWHALSRGQYDKAHPTDVFHDPKRFWMQLGLLMSGIAEEYNWAMLLLALVPFFYFLKMQKRERSWIVGVGSIYMCIGVLLLILMNPSDDKTSVDLHKVFFTSSHGVVAILVGYGLALTTALMVTNYQKFRTVAPLLGGVALLPALMAAYGGISTSFLAGAGLENYNHRFTLFILMAAAFVLAAFAGRMLLRSAAPVVESSDDPKFHAILFAGGAVLCMLGAAYYAFFDAGSLNLGDVLAALPHSFAPKLANLPALAGMLVLGIVAAFIGLILFCRERAPLPLVLGLFALLPFTSIMSHWGPSEQRNHWFGYWFGHDMFTPPFTTPAGKLSYDPKLRAEVLKGPNAAVTYPEMARDAILFGGTDPGRFCPTYMIFCESFIPHHDQPVQDQNFDRRDVYIITQNALADDTYMEYVRAQYNRSQQIDPPFFQELLRGDNERKLNYNTNMVARIAYQTLDRPLTSIGASIEARRRANGVYPREEISIPNGDDMARAYVDYSKDVQRRAALNQLKQGEQPDASGHIQGQIPVMAINGLLTQNIFDKNPKNEFYVEESFPLDWMFPHLSPFGVIMKINRAVLPEITEEMVRRDHEFWSRYSERLTGNWITDKTSLKEIAEFVDKVYFQHDATGFTGNRQFIRDEQAQKSFSKLRTAIAGVYAWRLGWLVGTPTPVDFVAKTGSPERERMLAEADFAYKQAFAYCPFSPEVVFRYVQFLANEQRLGDASLIAETCLKLDPNNPGIISLVNQLHGMSGAPAAGGPAQGQATIEQAEKEVQDHPTNFQAAIALASMYQRLQQPAKAVQLLDQVLTNPAADAQVVTAVAMTYNNMGNFPKMEEALKRLVELQPGVPDHVYNLALCQAHIGKTNEALKSLGLAFSESATRLALNPKADDLQTRAKTDPILAGLTNLPEFQRLVGTPK